MLANLKLLDKEHGRRGEMFIWLKLGQNPSEMDFRTFCKDKECNLGPVAGY